MKKGKRRARLMTWRFFCVLGPHELASKGNWRSMLRISCAIQSTCSAIVSPTIVSSRCLVFLPTTAYEAICGHSADDHQASHPDELRMTSTVWVRLRLLYEPLGWPVRAGFRMGGICFLNVNSTQ